MVSQPTRRVGEWVRMREVPAPVRAKSTGADNAHRLGRRVRNHRLVDWWSATHFAWGAALTLLLGPWWGLGLMLAWEPIEILVLGPLLARKGIAFGHEGWRNMLSDAVFDAAGVAFAFFVIAQAWDPAGIL